MENCIPEKKDKTGVNDNKLYLFGFIFGKYISKFLIGSILFFYPKVIVWNLSLIIIKYQPPWINKNYVMSYNSDTQTNHLILD